MLSLLCLPPTPCRWQGFWLVQHSAFPQYFKTTSSSLAAKEVCLLDLPSRKTSGFCSEGGRELTANSHWHGHSSLPQAALRQWLSVMGSEGLSVWPSAGLLWGFPCPTLPLPPFIWLSQAWVPYRTLRPLTPLSVRLLPSRCKFLIVNNIVTLCRTNLSFFFLIPYFLFPSISDELNSYSSFIDRTLRKLLTVFLLPNCFCPWKKKRFFGELKVLQELLSWNGLSDPYCVSTPLMYWLPITELNSPVGLLD